MPLPGPAAAVQASFVASTVAETHNAAVIVSVDHTGRLVQYPADDMGAFDPFVVNSIWAASELAFQPRTRSDDDLLEKVLVT